jgi:prevent-host-death family protein
MKSLSATEFKTHCLSLLDEVKEKKISITIYKRGKPVAELRPVPKEPHVQVKLMGSVKIHGDILSSVIEDSDLNFEKGLV